MGYRKRKKRKEHEKQKWSFDTMLNLINIAVAVLPIQQFVARKEIPQIAFNGLMMILMLQIIYRMSIAAHIYHEEKENYKNNLEVLDEYAESREEVQCKYRFWEREFQKEYKNILKADVLKKIKVCFFFWIAIVTICISFPQNAHAFWDGVSGVNTTGEEKRTDISTEEDAWQPEKTEQKKRDMLWRFVLDQPTYSFALETQMKNQVYFFSEKNFSEWVTDVQETSKQWREEQKEAVDYKSVKDDEKKGFFDYTNSEDNFKIRVDNASQYIYYDEWLEHAPHSDEYEACIAGREKLNEVKIDGATGCYEIWWKLANDYLYFAQEYERQTADAEAILFYYTKSIYCCMEALKYSIGEAEYNRTYHFMVMRYHDICRDKCIISQEYKIRANNIYAILVETDALRNAR